MSASKKPRAKIEVEQKVVEVKYISDDDVLNIVTPYGGVPSRGNKRKSIRTQPKKSEQDSPLTTSITRSGRKVISRILPSNIHKEASNHSDSEDVEEDIVPEDNQKPSDLFEDNVAGSEVFGFKTPKKARAMLQKAAESSDVKKTPSKTDVDNRPAPPKTPHAFRENLKKKIKKEVERLEENLFDWSGSEYEPEDSSSESDSSALSEDDFVPLASIKKAKSPPPASSSRPRNAKPDYVFTSDEFFASKSGRSLTSNHTLNKLATPRMGQELLHNLLKEFQSNHYSHISTLNHHNTALFYRWLYAFKEGYNIVVYGLGSKRSLIETFRQSHLSQSNVLVINGYFPGLTIKEMTESVVEAVGGSSRGVGDGLETVLDKVKRRHRLFLLVHNIDGPMLRSDKAQQFLATLAHHPNIHLLASVDHINAPLLWDQKKLSKFKFIWEDGTSFLPYIEETRFESSIMVQSSGTLALAALKNVYKSLNSNSQNIFKLLLNHQLEAEKNNSGFQFSQLYRACRDKFYVSSDLVLRTQLTEFIDHQLVRWKKESDTLSIPVELSVLRQFKQEIEAEE